MKRLAALCFVLLSPLPLCAQMADAEATFTKDIAPILASHCTTCHRPGDVAPFSLLRYEDVVPRVRQIVAATARRTMPPWMPDESAGAFQNARRLSEAEIARIAAWAASGTPRGSADLTPPPQPKEDWPLGPPDLVVEAPAAFMLPPGTGEVFRTFVLPVPITTQKWVRGIDVRPGNRKVTHHASVSVDPTSHSRELDAADPRPGFGGGMFSEGARSPENRALGWTPGMRASFEPDDMAWRLQPGSDLVVELHVLPSASVEPIRPSVALYFSEVPPTRRAMDFKIGVNAIDIPAGEAAYVAEASFTLPVDVDVVSIYPHAHYLARDVRASATTPDGRVVPLIAIANWDFHWQDQYRYVTPVALPRGSTLSMRYTYDNSAGNRHNPTSPPRRVGYGPLSSDEMGDLWLRLAPRTPEDAAILAQAYRDNERAKTLLLNERIVAAQPANVSARLSLGVAYLESGRLRESVEQSTEAVRLDPRSVPALHNLGEALRLQGRIRDAIARYREALAISPDNVVVHLGLANAFEDDADFEAAATEFRRVIELNPLLGEAHNNLGIALASLNRFEEADEHFRKALAIDPDNADAQRNLARLTELKASSPR